METVNEIQLFVEASRKGQLVHRYDVPESMKRPSVVGWFRILRVHLQWPLFEAIRFALWLSR